MNQVEAYLLEQKGAKKELMLFFHDLFINQYKLSPKLSYGIPFYYGKKWVVYVNPDGKAGVELAFPNGFRFQNYREGLESKGRKMILSCRYVNLEELDLQQIEQWMQEALRIDKSLKK